MYGCPNCGGVLKFDISSQSLRCDHCSSVFDPYAVSESSTTAQSDTFDTTTFTCPQCGATMYTIGQDATSFCSFCGSPNVLHSRLNHEKRPDYILLFKKTKEDCKKIYHDRLKRAIFAPKDLKNEQYIDGFRGIYMPYWSYQLTQSGPVSLQGDSVEHRGNYEIRKTYSVSAELDCSYAGFSYDASESFDDDISTSLAPYDAKQLISFTPSFLSGFYAETADVPSSAYEANACELAADNTYSAISSRPELSGISLHSAPKKTLIETTHTKCKKADRTMFPVWFLSYRCGNRVAYATVNGQTGKLVCDIPIDPKKYILGSLLLSLPIFLLLNMFLTMIPSTLLMVSSGLSMIASLLFHYEVNSIAKKDELITNTEKKSPKKQKKSSWGYGIVLFISIVLIFLLFSSWKNGCFFLFTVMNVVIAIAGKRTHSMITDATLYSGFVAAVAASVVCLIVQLLHPVSDLYYYGASILSILCVLYTFMGIIFNFNLLSTRKLPQFSKTGGDNGVY